MRTMAAALFSYVLACLGGSAAAQTGVQPLAFADPILTLDRGDPANTGIDLYIEAAELGLSRGCREVVGAGRLASIVKPASLGPALAGAFDRKAIRAVLRRLNARYLVVISVRREAGRYHAVGVALDPARPGARLVQAASTLGPRQVPAMVRALSERIARRAGCPRWQGTIALKRTIEIRQEDRRTKASDIATEIEAVTYEFGAGSPKFAATIEAKLKRIRIRNGITVTREEETIGTGEGRVLRAFAYVRVDPDGRYWFVLGDVPVKANWRRYLCREPGDCQKSAGEKTVTVSGLRLSGKAAPGGRRFKGTRTIKSVAHITETLVWEFTRSDR